MDQSMRDSATLRAIGMGFSDIATLGSYLVAVDTEGNHCFYSIGANGMIVQEGVFETREKALLEAHKCVLFDECKLADMIEVDNIRFTVLDYSSATKRVQLECSGKLSVFLKDLLVNTISNIVRTEDGAWMVTIGTYRGKELVATKLKMLQLATFTLMK